MKPSPHQLKTVNVVENADGNVSITSYASTKAGKKAALKHFHDLVYDYELAEVEELPPEDMSERYPDINHANWTNEAGDYDILIVESQ